MRNAANAQLFLKALKEASKAVKEDYMLLPVAQSKKPTAKTSKATIFRERVYCYELYHQMRLFMPEALNNFTLSGEVEKRGHPVIREGGMPDFLVHSPGTMDFNLCIVEVKPITPSLDGLRKDLERLVQYLGFDDGPYLLGILLFYGSHKKRTPADLLRPRLRKYKVPMHLRDRIKFYWHKNAGGEAEEVQWDWSEFSRAEDEIV